MKRKIIIGLCSLLLSVDIYAKGGGGGGSWGEITTHNKYGAKKIVKNSRSKSSSFSQSDKCKQYIYIDTYSSFRTKDYIPGLFGSFQNGYATTKVTTGNDVASCKRTAFVVPYLLIEQPGGSPNERSKGWIKGYNKSFLRFSMKSGGVYNEYNTAHTVRFKDNTSERIEVFPDI